MITAVTLKSFMLFFQLGNCLCACPYKCNTRKLVIEVVEEPAYRLLFAVNLLFQFLSLINSLLAWRASPQHLSHFFFLIWHAFVCLMSLNWLLYLHEMKLCFNRILHFHRKYLGFIWRRSVKDRFGPLMSLIISSSFVLNLLSLGLFYGDPLNPRHLFHWLGEWAPDVTLWLWLPFQFYFLQTSWFPLFFHFFTILAYGSITNCWLRLIRQGQGNAPAFTARKVALLFRQLELLNKEVNGVFSEIFWPACLIANVCLVCGTLYATLKVDSRLWLPRLLYFHLYLSLLGLVLFLQLAFYRSLFASPAVPRRSRSVLTSSSWKARAKQVQTLFCPSGLRIFPSLHMSKHIPFNVILIFTNATIYLLLVF